MTRVGINGFGRIGRAIFRVNEQRKQFHVVAINDIDANVENHAYLLKYDSTYGRFNGQVKIAADHASMIVGGSRIHFYAAPDIAQVPWAEHDVDVLVDASGVHANVLSSRGLVERCQDHHNALPKRRRGSHDHLRSERGKLQPHPTPCCEH
jgi:glyceraldehyde 3-phosphate dehydrogenase